MPRMYVRERERGGEVKRCGGVEDRSRGQRGREEGRKRERERVEDFWCASVEREFKRGFFVGIGRLMRIIIVLF